MALAAFVFSLVSLVVPVIMTLVTVVLARRADRRIAASPGVRTGRQLTTAARVVSLTWCAFVLAVAGWLTVVSIMADDGDDDLSFDGVNRVLVSPQVTANLDRLLDRPGIASYDDDLRSPTPILLDQPGELTYRGDGRPTVGPMRFDGEAMLTYSTAGSYLTITVVGGDEREVVAHCFQPCDGQVRLGQFQDADAYELEIDTDGGWYLSVDSAYEVRD